MTKEELNTKYGEFAATCTELVDTTSGHEIPDAQCAYIAGYHECRREANEIILALKANLHGLINNADMNSGPLFTSDYRKVSVKQLDAAKESLDKNNTLPNW